MNYLRDNNIVFYTKNELVYTQSYSRESNSQSSESSSLQGKLNKNLKYCIQKLGIIIAVQLC